MYYEIEASWLHLTIDETFHKHTIAQFLDVYKQSKKNKYLLFQRKQILLNQTTANLDDVLHINDILSLQCFLNPTETMISDSSPIEVIYEDDFILLVNKPPHVLIHSDGGKELTLSNRVQNYFIQTEQDCPVHPIHRLDKETSGLVMFCKCLFFQPYFDDLLQQKLIHREYVAIAQGHLPLQQNIVVNQPIGRDRHNAKKQRISSSGKKAYTSFYCKQYVGHNSLVYCTLRTGRTHQIRIHLAYLKHPIVADSLYGKKDASIARLALHAYKLSWMHPITMKPRFVKTSLPCDIKKIL